MINAKIEQLMDTFGMTGKKAAKIMGITYTAFRLKKAQATYNKFHEENLQKLLDYINTEAAKLPKEAAKYEKSL